MKRNLICFGMILAGMAVASAVLLSLMSALIWKMDWGTKSVGICVVIIYILVNFIGGFFAGLSAKKQKFLWGIAIGVCYVIVLLLLSLIGAEGQIVMETGIVGKALICIIAAMFGGMLAPS